MEAIDTTMIDDSSQDDQGSDEITDSLVQSDLQGRLA